MKDKYVFHLLGLAHLPTAKKYNSCAFTQKNLKLSKMLCSLGHTVYLYGCRSTEEAPLEEYVQSDNFHFIETHTVKDIRADYGDGYNLNELGYDWEHQDFRHDLNGERKSSTQKLYANAINHINSIKNLDDFLLCTQGNYHRPVADGTHLFLKCESGIGYRGVTKDMFKAFESPYIQNFSYGSLNPFGSSNGSFYDRVIPNYFDPDDVEFSDEKDDYFLFVGRMIKRKGVLIAYEATKATGDRLIFAGQGAYIKPDGCLVDNDPQEYTIRPDSNWEYVGFQTIPQRKKLMARAKAVFTPTEYLECFAGVHVEAMLSGTPVITTDFGVYPYTIPDQLNGQIGFRCNTLQDFVDATRKVKRFNQGDYHFIRNNAERYLMDNVKYDYQKWFDDLHNVWQSLDGQHKGWSRVV